MASIFIFLGVLMSAVGAICAALASDSKGRIARRGAWAAFVGSLIGGFGGILSSVQQDTVTQKLIGAQEELLGWHTGGDSYPYITYAYSGTYAGRFLLHHHGKFPIYGLTVRVVDRDATNRPAFGYGDSDFEGKTFTFPTLVPGAMHPIDLAAAGFTGKENGLRLKIYMTAVNGSFIEYYRDTIVDHGFVSAIKVEKDEKVIFPSIPESFPRDEKGEAIF